MLGSEKLPYDKIPMFEMNEILNDIVAPWAPFRHDSALQYSVRGQQLVRDHQLNHIFYV